LERERDTTRAHNCENLGLETETAAAVAEIEPVEVLACGYRGVWVEPEKRGDGNGPCRLIHYLTKGRGRRRGLVDGRPMRRTVYLQSLEHILRREL
jgi:hypothetical protein